MSRLVPLALLSVCLGASRAAAAEQQRPFYDPGFFEPGESVVTPHIAWAKPYYRGAPKVLFLTHRNAMREVIELAQRLGMDYRVFACESPSEFGETGQGVDASWKLIRGNSAEELAGRLRGDLQRDYDVIVVGNIKWDELPLDCRYEILRKVKAGAGLVGCLSGGRDKYLEQILGNSDLSWNWGLWSGGAQGIPDYFGIGVFEGAVDYGAAHSGTACLRIVGREAKQGSREAPRAGYSPGPIALEPNTEYVFSMWTKTQGLQNGGALVSLHPQPGGVPVPASDGWTLAENRFTTDDKTLMTGVYLLNFSVGTVWYDDVKLAQAGDERNLLPNPGFENPGPLPEGLAAGFPFQSLPAFAANADAQAFLTNTLQVTRFGEGGIGLLRYGGVPLHQMVTPGPAGDVRACRLDYDYYLALAAKLILWGARKEPEVTVSTPAGAMVSGDREELAGKPLTFNLRAISPVRAARVELTVRGRPNRVWHSASQTRDLKRGDNAASFPLPALPRGSYFADLWVKSGEATVTFGSVGLSVTSKPSIRELTLSEDSVALGEPLTGRAVIENASGAETVRFRARDNHGRLVAQQEMSARTEEVAFSLPMPPSLTIVGQLEAALLRGKDIIDVRSADYSINNLRPDREDAEHVMWIGYPGDFLGPLMAEQFTRLGVDAQYGGGPGYAPFANQWWLPYATRFTDDKTDWYQPRPTREKDDLVRDPCLTNPEYREKVREDLTKTAGAGAKYSTSEFTLGDENLFVSGPFDLCFSDTCVPDFRRWAQEVYGSLDKLNTEWGSSYRKWEEVRPSTLEQCQKTGNFVPWVDHRLHMESVWAGIHGFSREAIRQVIPDARVGYEGSDTYLSSWLAADYWKLAGAMNLNNIYYRDFLSLVWHDFAPPEMLLGEGWYGGYAGCRNEPFMRWFPWRTLFKGASSFWVWQGYGDAGSVMAFDLAPYPFFRAGCEEVAKIKSGPAKLLLTSERQHDGIALLYSASSVHLATCTPGFPDMDTTLDTMVRLLDDVGLECRVISYAELAAGKVTNDQFKVLLLPCAQALSSAEADEVRRFAQRGGAVIADLRPGITDEHGKPYATPCLDDLFGVAQAPAFKRAEGALEFAAKLPQVVSDASLSAKAGRAEGRVGEAPAVISHEAGRGRTVLLNFSLNGYASLPQKPGVDFAGWEEGRGYRNLVASLLEAAGVKPAVGLRPDPRRVEVSRFRSGGNEYVGIIQGLPVDSLQYTNRIASPPKAWAATIRFSRRAHVYDVRAGTYIGETEAVNTELTPGMAKLYALLPYEVTRIGVAAPKEARPGDALAWRSKVHAAGGVGHHVLRLRVFGPDGQERPYYAANCLARVGEAGGVLHFALDDPPGTWKLLVRDVATGVSGSAQVKLSLGGQP